MSDTDQPDQEPDFRGSREERRQDETVMLNADSLSDMVDEAKEPAATPPPAAAPGAAAPSPAAAPSDGPNMTLIIGVVLIIVIAIGLGMYFLV